MLENGKNMNSSVTVIPIKCQQPHSPFQFWKIVKCKLALDKVFCQHCTGVGGGGGQNAYKMKFPTLVTKVVACNGGSCACEEILLKRDRSPSLGDYNFHNKPMQRHFYRPVYF